MSRISRTNAPRYQWGEGCEGWHLLADAQLSVIEECVPAGAAEVMHRHAHARQFFYVLDGEAVMEIAGETHPLSTGQGLHVAPGVAHQFRNESGADVRVLVISTPPSHGDRIEEAA